MGNFDKKTNSFLKNQGKDNFVNRFLESSELYKLFDGGYIKMEISDEDAYNAIMKAEYGDSETSSTPFLSRLAEDNQKELLKSITKDKNGLQNMILKGKSAKNTVREFIPDLERAVQQVFSEKLKEIGVENAEEYGQSIKYTEFKTNESKFMPTMTASGASSSSGEITSGDCYFSVKAE